MPRMVPVSVLPGTQEICTYSPCLCPLCFPALFKTANLSHRAPAARPGCATCCSKKTRTNSPMLYHYKVTYPQEVRLIRLLPTLLHFPGNCTKHELMRNNEPAHRGREDNSEQQQRKLMGKYVLTAHCRRLSLQACITPRELSLLWEDTRTAESTHHPHNTGTQEKGEGGLCHELILQRTDSVGSPDKATDSVQAQLCHHALHGLQEVTKSICASLPGYRLQCPTPAPSKGVDYPWLYLATLCSFLLSLNPQRYIIITASQSALLGQ